MLPCKLVVNGAMKMDAAGVAVGGAGELKMGVPYVTSFCWCLGLEAGAKCVGYLHLITSVCLTVVCAMFTAGAAQMAGTAEDAGDRLYSTWLIIGIAVSCISVVHVLLACLLLVATYKRNAVLVRVWVVVMCVLAAAALLYVVTTAALGFSDTGSDIFLAFVEGLLFFGVVAYCIVSVNSYYMMLSSLATDDHHDRPGKGDY